MADTVFFDFECDIHGACVVVVREPLTQRCSSDGEIDHCIKALKDNLDAVAAKMKKAIREQRAKPVF